MIEGGYGEFVISCEIDRRRAVLVERKVALRQELNACTASEQGDAQTVRTARRPIGGGLAGARRALSGVGATLRSALVALSGERRGLTPGAEDSGGD